MSKVCLQPEDEYRPPSLDEIALFSQQFSDEHHKAIGEAAEDVAVEVSSPVSLLTRFASLALPTKQSNAYGTPQSTFKHEKGIKIKVCARYIQGPFEKCYFGQDQVKKGRQEEVTQEVTQEARASPQGRDRHAQEGSLLQASLPQIRHFDCEVLFLIPSNRCQALMYCNGELVEEMYDLSVVQLKKRLKDS